MTSVTFRLDDSLSQRFDGLVTELGLNKSSVMRDAIAAKLDELEEVLTIQKRLKERDNKISSDELWANLGIND